LHEVKVGKKFEILKREITAGKNTTIIRMKESCFIIYRSSNKSGARDVNSGGLSRGTIMILTGWNE
jgi:hypothetical protein